MPKVSSMSDKALLGLAKPKKNFYRNGIEIIVRIAIILSQISVVQFFPEFVV